MLVENQTGNDKLASFAGLGKSAPFTSFSPFDWASAHAQKLAEARKKVDRKTPTPKDTQKDQQERAPFTVEEENAAVVPGIPDARVWGDSAADFVRLLPARTSCGTRVTDRRASSCCGDAARGDCAAQ
jgi:hypothetical protein